MEELDVKEGLGIRLPMGAASRLGHRGRRKANGDDVQDDCAL